MPTHTGRNGGLMPNPHHQPLGLMSVGNGGGLFGNGNNGLGLTTIANTVANLGNNGGGGGGMMFQTQPRMLSFREFAMTMLDPSDRANKQDQVRQTRYNLYKESFRAEQTRLFFEAHKAEDWFRLRYHPRDAPDRKNEQRCVIQRRLRIFRQLYALHEPARDNGLALSASDAASLGRLYKFLDACLVRLEDGDERDLAVLDRIYKNDDAVSYCTLPAADRGQPSEKEKRERRERDGGSDDNNENSDESEEEEGRLPKVETKTDVEKKEEEAIAVPKRTQSIFFKYLPVDVTRQDLETVCKIVLIINLTI
jgi:hypothetical protein